MKYLFLVFLTVTAIVLASGIGGGVASGPPAPSVQFTFSSPINRLIVQRNSGVGVVPIAGTTQNLTGDNARARVEPVSGFPGTTSAWQSVPTTAGVVSGNINAAPGWYHPHVQVFIGPTLISDLASAVIKVGVGDIIITGGQSNATNYYQPFVGTAPDDRVNSRGITNSNLWANAVDPQPTADNTFSSIVPALGNLLVAHTGFPVGFVSTGLGNTDTNSWLPSGSNYARIRSAVQLFPTNGFLTFIWIQGENDAAESVSQSTYTNNMETIINQLRTDAGWTVPVGMANTETHPDEATGSGVQAAQLALTAFTSCYSGANGDSLGNTYRQGDNTHFNTTTGQSAFATLWYNAIVTQFGL